MHRSSIRQRYNTKFVLLIRCRTWCFSAHGMFWKNACVVLLLTRVRCLPIIFSSKNTNTSSLRDISEPTPKPNGVQSPVLWLTTCSTSASSVLPCLQSTVMTYAFVPIKKNQTSNQQRSEFENEHFLNSRLHIWALGDMLGDMDWCLETWLCPWVWWLRSPACTQAPKHQSKFPRM